MSSGSPVTKTFCALVVTSCLLNNFLLATPLVMKRSADFENDIHNAYGQSGNNPNEDQSFQSDINENCRSLAYDTLSSSGHDWGQTDAGKELSNYLDLLEKSQGSTRGDLLLRRRSSRENTRSLLSKFKRPDLLNLKRENQLAETGGIHSSDEESLAASRDKFHKLCYLALTGLVDEISPNSNLKGERDQTGHATLSSGNVKQDSLFLRPFLDQLNGQKAEEAPVEMLTPSKRGRSDNTWLDMARSMVKRRKVRLSINNALMTLTDMIVAHQARRILRQRSILREQLLAAG